VFAPPDLRLRALVREAVAERRADVLLLSGGVDSSLLAAFDTRVPAVTVGLAGGSDDLAAAKTVAAHLGITWLPVELSRRAALKYLEELVRMLNSYNLELLNHIPLFVGGRVALGLGATAVRTGEFADELFRGYAYLYDYPDADFASRVRPRAGRYRPPSAEVFAPLGLVGVHPYHADSVVSYAAGLRRAHNVVDVVCGRDGDAYTELNGGTPGLGPRRWGKAALRRAAWGLLPDAIAARPKADLMFGSGMVRLEHDLAALVTPDEVADFEEDGRWFVDGSRAAHAGLYKLYRNAGLSPRPPTRAGEHPCLGCGGAVLVAVGDYCRTCGRYPASTA
jgi:asparagine synthase (glutamine-hydrolysing)